MKVFASWCGGKDCTLAVFRYLRTKDSEVTCLVNMCDEDGKHSRSHGLKKSLIYSQANAMNILIWEKDTKLLLKEFIDVGFKALTVAVNTDKLNEDWLGRILDLSFYDEITSMTDIDPCAENGESHSFVYEGPIFSKSVKFSKGAIYKNDNPIFLPLN